MSFPLNDSKLDRMLRFDALDEAENFTGESYKISRDTEALGFALLIQNNAAREKALMERGDTTFSNDLDRYIEIITTAGFVKVFEEDFVDDEYPDHGVMTNTFYVFAHPDGLLLEFDTYGGRDDPLRAISVNSGKVYYNWVSNPLAEGEKRDYGIMSSGGMYGSDEDGWVWVGDHDCREALIFNLDRLRKNGTFLAPWKKRPHLSLLHYMDWHRIPDHKVDYKAYTDYSPALTEKKISQLPDWVQEMIGPERA